MKKKELKNFYTRNIKLEKVGYINPLLPWFSCTDLSKKFGTTRQNWEKKIREGKLNAHKTSSGNIIPSESLFRYIENNIL